MMQWVRKRWLYMGLPMLLVGLIFWLTRPEAADTAPIPDLVSVSPVTQQSMPRLIKASGRLVPSHPVDLRAEVAGTITAIYFKEGQSVTQGQLLYQIDDRTARADLAKTQALLTKDTSAADLSKTEAGRYRELIASAVISQEDEDKIESTLKSDQAQVSAAEASLKSTAALLEKTKIYAPVSGKIGLTRVKVGNLVQPSDPLPLATLTDPVDLSVAFEIPDTKLAIILQALKQHVLTVKVFDETHHVLIDEIPLDFIDNSIDPDSGTVELRAPLSHPKTLIWPGQKVAVELIYEIQDQAIVVPTSAVKFGQKGNYVFLNQDQIAILKPVSVDRQLGPLAVVQSGLSVGDQVINNAPSNLEAGDHIRVQQASA